MILRTYRFRLYPSSVQEEKLLHTLGICRLVYNKMLEMLGNQQRPNRTALQNTLPILKKQSPKLNSVYSKVLQYEPYRLFSNLRSLAALKKNGKKVGKLRFKSKGCFKTFTYNQSGFALTETGKRYSVLNLSKIGNIPLRAHRKVDGKLKQLTVKHYASGKWFAMLTAEYDKKVTQTQSKPGVGIDLGITNLIYDSDGNSTSHPKFLNKSLRKLGFEQKRLSKKKKGSANRRKQRVKVARIYEKVINQRDDFLHKLSHNYVNSYGLIAVENLNILGIARKSFNARNLLDASWAKFINMLEYKAESAGIQVIKVDAKNTTQKCSRCGRIVVKQLWHRVHKCVCGLQVDRDFNAAKNILARAVGREPPDFKPVKTEPLPVRQVWSRKQEAAEFIRQ